jgi:hypothetical protein
MTVGAGGAAVIVLSEPLLETMTGREMRGILADRQPIERRKRT